MTTCLSPSCSARADERWFGYCGGHWSRLGNATQEWLKSSHAHQNLVNKVARGESSNARPASW